MAYTHTTIADVLAALNEERPIRREDVAPRVLSAHVWQSIVSSPGCLGDAFSIDRSREGALSSVEYWLDDDTEYSARYVRGRLRRNGICYLRDGRVITLGRITISDTLA